MPASNQIFYDFSLNLGDSLLNNDAQDKKDGSGL